MTDRLFASCCLGTDTQHASWEQCPVGDDAIAAGSREGGDAQQAPLVSGDGAEGKRQTSHD